MLCNGSSSILSLNLIYLIGGKRWLVSYFWVSIEFYESCFYSVEGVYGFIGIW